MFGILLCDFIPKEEGNEYLLWSYYVSGTVLGTSHVIWFNSLEKQNNSDGENSLIS